MKNIILTLLCICAINTALCAQSKAQITLPTDNIIVTNNAAVINNLSAIGPAETTKTAFMGNKDNLTIKAELELKQQALAKGGNIVFVTKNDFIADPNSYFKKVHMVGVVYQSQRIAANSAATPTNAVVASSASDTTKTLIPGLTLSVTDCIGDPVAQTVTLYFTFTNETNISRNINVFGGPKSNGVIAVNVQNSTIFDDNGNQYSCKDDFYALSGKELPAGLKLKGMVTFSNVLPSAKIIALAKLSIGFSDWDGGRNRKGGVIQFKNLKINWSAAAPNSTPLAENHWNIKIKNINNGIDFTVLRCVGNVKMQTVTLSFAFNNPRKSNQRVSVQSGFYDNKATAFDNDGNQYPFKNISLADVSNSNQIEKELPTGLMLKGSITFSNILPTIKGLAMAKIPVVTSNWDGGDNMVSGMIEVQDIAIVWDNNIKNPPH